MRPQMEDYFVQKTILAKFEIALLFSATCFFIRAKFPMLFNPNNWGIVGSIQRFCYRAAKFAERSSLLMCLLFFAAGFMTLKYR